MFSPSRSFLPVLALFSAVIAQSSSSYSLQNIFLQSPPNDDQFVGSVVAVNNGLTTYAIACTSGTYSCVPSVTISVTEGSSTFGLSTSTVTAGVTALVQESCTVAGTTSATCVVTISVSSNGVSTTLTSTSTIGTSAFHYAPVTITAGAEKLASAATATATTRSSTAGAAAARVTGLAGAAVVAGVGGFVALL